MRNFFFERCTNPIWVSGRCKKICEALWGHPYCIGLLGPIRVYLGPKPRVFKSPKKTRLLVGVYIYVCIHTQLNENYLMLLYLSPTNFSLSSSSPQGTRVLARGDIEACFSSFFHDRYEF